MATTTTMLFKKKKGTKYMTTSINTVFLLSKTKTDKLWYSSLKVQFIKNIVVFTFTTFIVNSNFS